jgi:hypothetical protein
LRSAAAEDVERRGEREGSLEIHGLSEKESVRKKKRGKSRKITSSRDQSAKPALVLFKTS